MVRMNKRPDEGAPKSGAAGSGWTAAALRQQAEELALKTAALSRENEKALSPETTRLMLHELHVHQIELEMQNEELRRTQVELEAARARYFDLYDLAPVGYCSVSEQGLILQANLAAATLLGQSRGALAKQPISGVIFKDDQDIYYLCRKQLVATGEAQACELRMVKSDGTRFWVQLAVTAALDAGGSAVMRVVLNDIHDRKLMESAMRESEERYRVLVEWSPDAIAVHRAGLIVYANPAAVRMVGAKSVMALMGRPILAIVHPDSHAVVRPLLDLAGSGANAPLTEMRFLKLDGTPIAVEAQGTAIVYEGEPATHVAWRDITDRRQADKALRETQARLRQALDAADLGTWNIDAETGLFTSDERFRAIFGMTVEGLDTEQALSPVHPDDSVRIHAAVAAATRPDNPLPYNVEYRVIHPDGTVHWVSADGRATFTGPGTETRLLSFAGTVADITERKHVEQALRESEEQMRLAMEEARQANRAKSDFLSSMSHELRTPLSAVLGFAQLLESGTPALTPSQKRSIDQILQAGWYLLQLINEILDLASIESGKLALSLEPMSLAGVIPECQAMVEPQAQKRAIKLIFPRLEVPYFVNADRIRVKQVLVNLLSNAIKYNKAGGTVVMECTVSAPQRIRIRVTDTGQGLAPDQMAQLFQPFNRLGQEANVEEGTGIGLVMCKRLIELMGGAIGVESTVGKGSVFWVEMNLAAEPQPADGASTPMAVVQAKAPSDARLRTLLYLEDNPANLMLMEDLIARRPDIRMLSARDAYSGIKLARASRPDVILMDINLPGIDGIEALGILALDQATAHIPVIALSASAMPQDIEKGLAAGFLRYLTKPIKVDRFMDALDETLEFAKAASDRAAIESGRP